MSRSRHFPDPSDAVEPDTGLLQRWQTDVAPVHDRTWRTFIDRLEDQGASVFDTLEATTALYSLEMPWPDAFAYQGEMHLDEAQDAIDARIERERVDLAEAMRELVESLLKDKVTLGGDASNDASLGDRIGPAFDKENVVDAIENIVQVYVEHREGEERFLDTYRRIGITPFKERVYAAKEAA